MPLPAVNYDTSFANVLKTGVLKLDTIAYMCVSVLLSGCLPESSSRGTRQSGGITTSTVKVNAMSQIENSSNLSPHAAELAEAVQRSQARLASGSSNLCPKLIDFTVGQTMRLRKDEQLKNGECRYFIYPQRGRKLGVRVNNQLLAVELVQPRYFNFASGEYTVRREGKHVIRVRYRDTHHTLPANSESYDLKVVNTY